MMGKEDPEGDHGNREYIVRSPFDHGKNTETTHHTRTTIAAAADNI
jgi:hypothetical protein